MTHHNIHPILPSERPPKRVSIEKKCIVEEKLHGLVLLLYVIKAMVLKNYLLLFIVTLLSAYCVHSQDMDEDLYRQPDVYPSPLIGTDSLVKLLEDRISKGDTIGTDSKKISVQVVQLTFGTVK